MFQKPRLRYSRKTWDCRSASFPMAVGYGYSAAAAFEDWISQLRRYLYGGS